MQSIAAGYAAVRILTDSRYVIDCTTKYWAKWTRTGFKTMAGTPVANVELFDELQKLMQEIEVSREL